MQLATYLGPAYAKSFYAGIGPYLQLPASNTNNVSKQTGLGLSAVAFFTPENWVIGATMYNSWGVGSNMAGGPPMCSIFSLVFPMQRILPGLIT